LGFSESFAPKEKTILVFTAYVALFVINLLPFMSLNHLLNSKVSDKSVSIVLIYFHPWSNHHIFVEFELMLNLMSEKPHFNNLIKHRLLPYSFMYLIYNGYLLLFINIDRENIPDKHDRLEIHPIPAHMNRDQ
jgi:hypothetical protein